MHSILRRALASIIPLLIAFAPTGTPAQHIGLYADVEGTDDVLDPQPLMEPFSVYVVSGSAIRSALFSLRIPVCLPYVVLGWSAMPGVTVEGDLETGMGLTTECLVGNLPMLKIDLMRTGDATNGCCTLQLSPLPGLTSIYLYDCAGYLSTSDCDLWLSGDSTCVDMEPPSTPSPADGAVAVELDVTLDCEIHEGTFSPRCGLLSYTWTWVYFGTSPNPPLASNGGSVPYQPGYLAPGTRYYWRVVYKDINTDPISSPVWSFTTITSTPTQSSTWGAVKALYR